MTTTPFTHVASPARRVATPPAGGLIAYDRGTAIIEKSTRTEVAFIALGPAEWASDSDKAIQELRQELLCHGWMVRRGTEQREARPATTQELRGLRACPECDAPAATACATTCRGLSRRRADPTWRWV